MVKNKRFGYVCRRQFVVVMSNDPGDAVISTVIFPLLTLIVMVVTNWFFSLFLIGLFILVAGLQQ